jgi:lipopolysaccharide export system protein LptC
MTVAPVPLRRHDAQSPPGVSRLTRARPPIHPRQARRRWMVGLWKRLLPVVALALLASVALWPELAREREQARVAYRSELAAPQSGEMIEAVYHGVDERGRPYTMTASKAHQISPERINLTDPKGDITLESGNWLMAQSRQGVYLQQLGNLDLSQDVVLYRDDGTTIATDTATVDLKAGVAAGADMVHAEGPFGVLDAQGFTLTDKGSAIQFFGPGHLVLNSARGPASDKRP